MGLFKKKKKASYGNGGPVLSYVGSIDTSRYPDRAGMEAIATKIDNTFRSRYGELIDSNERAKIFLSGEDGSISMMYILLPCHSDTLQDAGNALKAIAEHLGA